jgi:uncharacterized protein YkwD
MKNNVERIIGILFVCVMIIVFFSVVGNESRLYYQEVITCKESRSVENIIELTNRSRIENGVHPLTESEKLTRAAEAKVNDMFGSQYFNHDSPNGDSSFVFVEAAGYSYRYAGENLVRNFVCAETAQQALMNSPSHRKNILNEEFDEIGVSIEQGILDGKKTILTVYFFGTTE